MSRLEGGEDFATVAAEVDDDVRPAPPAATSGVPEAAAPRRWTGRSGPRTSAAVASRGARSSGTSLIVVSERGTLTFEGIRDDLKAAVEAQRTTSCRAGSPRPPPEAQVTVDPGAGTWDAAKGLVKAIGAMDAAELELSPEDPNNPSDDLTPSPSSTSSTIAVPLPTTTSTP